MADARSEAARNAKARQSAEAEARDLRKQVAAATARAERVAGLLAARETELGRMQGELKRRDKVLSAELSRTKAREVAARKAGRAAEADAASRTLSRLDKERGALRKRLAAHQAELADARSEAARNAKARQSAEAEARDLRKQLKQREQALATMSDRSAKGAATALSAKEREVRALRQRLAVQVAERDRKLARLETTLDKRLTQSRDALSKAAKDNDALERQLASARAGEATERKRAEVKSAELARTQKRVAEKDAELARTRKLAAAAQARAERVTKLLSARERDLDRMQGELKRRESVLSQELSRAKAREVAARKAGHASEAATASRLRARLDQERVVLRKRLSVHGQDLAAARKEATRNAAARSAAESEANALRKQLQEREQALIALRGRDATGKKVAKALGAKEREVRALRQRLADQITARDGKLVRLEKTLNSRLAASRAALLRAEKDNNSLERQLTSARVREASERKHAETARKNAAAERQRAERVGRLLVQREGELKHLQAKLAKRQGDLQRKLEAARASELRARKSGRAVEERRIAAVRGGLERDLGGLRGDLKRSESELIGARAEAARHAAARKTSEARATKLAQALVAREAELSRLSRAMRTTLVGQGRAGKQADADRKLRLTEQAEAKKRLGAAEASVAAARTRLVEAQRQTAAAEKRFEHELGARVDRVRAEMAEREKARVASLQKTHARELAAARVSAQLAASASTKRTRRVANLLGRREEELLALRKETTARVDRLQLDLADARLVAKKALSAGMKREAAVATRRAKSLSVEVKAARKVAAQRERDVATARGEAAKEQRARQLAEQRAAKLSASLRARADELARLRTDRRSSTRRIADAERAFAESRRKLESANAKLDAEVKLTHKRLQDQIASVRKQLTQEYTKKEIALKRTHAAREEALQSALALEQARRRQAESLASKRPSRTSPTADLGGFNRRHQTRIAILEARASREREAREKQDRASETDRASVVRLKRELAAARQARVADTDDAEIQRRAAAMAAQMVVAAKRGAAAKEAADQSDEERRRIRQQAAVERMRSRKHAASDRGMARVLDVRITAEGYHRGQVALPLNGVPRYEVMETGGRRAVLRLHGTVLPSHLQRVFDTRELRGPMERVTVFRPQNQPNETRVVVDLVQPASNVVSVKDGRLVWDFVRAGRRHTDAGGRQFAAGGALGARAPQPQAPREAGGEGAPQGAGINSNPIRTPWRQSRRYTGKRINLTIKDADIRHVLTFLAREGNVNIIAGPEVTGSVTFHLENIPWDLALDVILRARGMDYVRQSGVIRVSTVALLKKEFDLAVERRKKLQEVKQLVIRIIPVNYGRATSMQEQVRTVISKSGTVSVNKRTNSLLVKDTEEHVAAVEEMVRKLDAQTPQVLVEARIVEASSNFSKDVGIQWGGNYAMSSVYGNETGLAFPSVVGVAGGADGGEANVDGVKSPIPNYAVNMPAAVGAGSGGAIGLTLGSLGGAGNLNLRLSAAENEGTVKLVSSPKVLTLDNKTASIRQGISIPISVVSAQGVQTRFVNADLRLQVTPHITQDGNILMAIGITKNEPDFSNRAADGNPTITQREATTELLLGDGETTVIGGIYTRSTSDSVKKVPFFGSLPLIGGLFRSRSEEDKRTELLIFITPRIVNRAQSMRVGK